tara:strand:+ start:435 stop:1028 length:594 start_codon:yes stop_codon:yes gene_type:complete
MSTHNKSSSSFAVLPYVPMEELIAEILYRIDNDPEREGIQKTPERIARSLAFLTEGYKKDPHEVVNGALYKQDHQNMVLIKDIEIYSLCEHHLLPFFGKAHIAYIPDGHILGLSKFARLAEIYARRLQTQERLTEQIAQAVWETTTPQGVAVVIEASHLCMMMRGVQKQNSKTITSAMRGVFLDDQRTRDEFLGLIS